MQLLLVALVLAALAPGPEVREARALYEKALSSWKTRTEDGLREGLRLFGKAAELDSGFALAHAGVADASCLLSLYGFAPPHEVMPEARDSARQAIHLDPTLAEAHAALGLVRYLYEWRFEPAEASFVESLELDPSYVSAHHWYAMMLMAVGRYPDSLEHIERAIELEPASPLYDVKRGTILLAAKNLDEAETHLRRSLERHPESPLGHRELGRLELERGRPEAALSHLERAAELSGRASRTEATYGLVLGLLGRTDEARRVLEALRREDKLGYVSPIAFALVHAGLGERKEALDALERALEARDSALVYIRTEPGFAGIRSEPRFRAIEREVFP